MVTSSLQSLGYLPVSTATLCAATVLNFDLYIQQPGRQLAELYRERNYPLRDEDMVRLRNNGIDHLYIRLEESEYYHTIKPICVSIFFVKRRSHHRCGCGH